MNKIRECEKEVGQVFLFHLGNLNKILFKTANRYFAGSGLAIRVEQLPLLMTLFYKGPQSQQELAAELGRDKASIQRTVRLLADHAYVEIGSDPDDGRKNIIYLTAHGKEVSGRIIHMIIRIDKLMFSVISEQDKSRLIGIIHKIGRRIEKKQV